MTPYDGLPSGPSARKPRARNSKRSVTACPTSMIAPERNWLVVWLFFSASAAARRMYGASANEAPHTKPLGSGGPGAVEESTTRSTGGVDVGASSLAAAVGARGGTTAGGGSTA